MKFFKTGITSLAMVCAMGVGVSQAGTDLNEIAPLLIFPGVVTSGTFLGGVETWTTVTNASNSPWNVHFSYINGEAGLNECNECNFNVLMTPNDTETLIFVHAFGNTQIVSLDLNTIMTCPWTMGFVTAALEDPVTGESVSMNALLGEEVIVDYTSGSALSVSAVPFQGKDTNDGNRWYAFDDIEYGKLPNVIAADFIAPDLSGGPISHVGAALTLFTPGFVRNMPPTVDCSVTGHDAFENTFSTSFKFGCWTHIALEDIHPEFAFPNLGQLLFNTHGWLRLACQVDVYGDHR
ncbi:MAG: hypothetical protein ACE5ID_04535, partial [Acidobacteriota bacterium]